MVSLFKRERITRHDNDPYLDRFIIFKCAWFGIFLHRFLDSDDECLHCHPWPFVSLILRGGYWEHVGEQYRQVYGQQWLWSQVKRRWHAAGSILFRRADHAHRIEIRDPGRTVSIVLIGPRFRTWGFFTSIGWLPWFQYRYAEHCS